MLVESRDGVLGLGFLVKKKKKLGGGHDERRANASR